MSLENIVINFINEIKLHVITPEADVEITLIGVLNKANIALNVGVKIDSAM